jgi:hypothetical protein
MIAGDSAASEHHAMPMSDVPPLGPPPVPLMSPDKARDVARAYRTLADHLTEFGLPRQAGIALRDSQWWLTYSIVLAQTKPDLDAA